MIPFILDMGAIGGYSGAYWYCRVALKWKISDSALWWLTASSRGLLPGTRRGFSKAHRPDYVRIGELEQEMESARASELKVLEQAVDLLGRSGGVPHRWRAVRTDPVTGITSYRSEPAPDCDCLECSTKSFSEALEQEMKRPQRLKVFHLEDEVADWPEETGQRRSPGPLRKLVEPLEQEMERQHAILNKLHQTYQQYPSEDLKQVIKEASERYDRLARRRAKKER